MHKAVYSVSYCLLCYTHLNELTPQLASVQPILEIKNHIIVWICVNLCAIKCSQYKYTCFYGHMLKTIPKTKTIMKTKGL